MAQTPEEGASNALELSFRKRAFERWLEHGWSPPKVAGWVLAAVTEAVPLYGYLSHPGRPGAVWWLVAALGVACFWGLTDAARWRIRHGRLHKLHGSQQSDLLAERGAHAATRELLSNEQAAHVEVRSALEKEQARPVDKPHRDRLFAVANNLWASVDQKQKCNYTDGRGDNDPVYAKGMMEGHFPKLVPVLDRWDSLIEDEAGAVDRLYDYVVSEVRDRGMNNSPWLGQTIVNAFRAHIARCRVHSDSPLGEPDLDLQDLRDSFKHEGWNVSGTGYMIFNSVQAGEDAPRLRSEFSGLFAAVRDSEEFRLLRREWAAMISFQKVVRRDLQAIKKPEEVYGRCQACSREF
ncbi:MAG TPA: hypothetical protein VMV22_00280 [Acidimicrobiales bacterium]|nr:hypothetical protein [Acidimicrobiales bacterium]